LKRSKPPLSQASKAKHLARSKAKKRSRIQTAAKPKFKIALAEQLELERLYSRAVLTLVYKNDSALYRRLVTWSQDVTAEINETAKLWNAETALRALRRRLKNPILPDLRKKKSGENEDLKITQEYRLILIISRLFPRRGDLIEISFGDH
jgi:hypothetical protein